MFDHWICNDLEKWIQLLQVALFLSSQYFVFASNQRCLSVSLRYFLKFNTMEDITNSKIDMHQMVGQSDHTCPADQSEPIAYFWGMGFIEPGTQLAIFLGKLKQHCWIKAICVKHYVILFKTKHDKFIVHTINTITPSKVSDWLPL